MFTLVLFIDMDNRKDCTRMRNMYALRCCYPIELKIDNRRIVSDAMLNDGTTNTPLFVRWRCLSRVDRHRSNHDTVNIALLGS